MRRRTVSPPLAHPSRQPLPSSVPGHRSSGSAPPVSCWRACVGMPRTCACADGASLHPSTGVHGLLRAHPTQCLQSRVHQSGEACLGWLVVRKCALTPAVECQSHRPYVEGQGEREEVEERRDKQLVVGGRREAAIRSARGSAAAGGGDHSRGVAAAARRKAQATGGVVEAAIRTTKCMRSASCR